MLGLKNYTLEELEIIVKNMIENDKFRIIKTTEKGAWRTTVGPELKAEQGTIFWIPNVFIPIKVEFKDKYKNNKVGFLKELIIDSRGNATPVIATTENIGGSPSNYQIDWKQMKNSEILKLIPVKF